MDMSSQDFLARAQRALIYLGGFYLLGLLLLTTPSIQRHLLYLHKVPWPLWPDYHNPHKYGLAPHKAMNLNITTSDDETLGGWFILSDAFYQEFSKSSGRSSRPFVEEEIRKSLREHPTVIFFHGNAASRAAPYRVSLYSSLSTRLAVNVLAIDYRGFGDSTGVPSEAGLLRDGRAAWDWLINQGAKADSIVIMGHSLGTSVSALLGEQLALEGIHPRGVALMAPFTSVFEAARTYTLFEFIPLLRPLASLPGVYEAAMQYLQDKLDTQSRLPKIKSTILIVHAINDPTIPHSHSAALFDELLEPNLPPLPYTVKDLAGRTDEEMWNKMNVATEARRKTRARLVSCYTIPDFADVSEFQRPDAGKVMHIETRSGRHINILKSEGLLGIMGDLFSIMK